MKIEHTVLASSLPVNSKAMVARLRELMDENQTNSLALLKDNPNVRAVMWLLNSQVFGLLAAIDMCDEWKWIKEHLEADDESNC